MFSCHYVKSWSCDHLIRFRTSNARPPIHITSMRGLFYFFVLSVEAHPGGDCVFCFFNEVVPLRVDELMSDEIAMAADASAAVDVEGEHELMSDEIAMETDASAAVDVEGEYAEVDEAFLALAEDFMEAATRTPQCDLETMKSLIEQDIRLINLVDEDGYSALVHVTAAADGEACN